MNWKTCERYIVLMVSKCIYVENNIVMILLSILSGRYNPLFFQKNMQSKISRKWLLFTIGIVAIIWSSIYLFFLTPNLSVQGSSSTWLLLTTKNHISTKITSWLPIRLKISKIKVNAIVDYVGLTPAGAMDIWEGPAGVSWYDLGPRPGQTGSAVIAGHNWIRKNGDISVFHDLNILRKGDIVSVENDNGEIISFVVRESKIYKKNASTLDVFTSRDGKSHLNLITCIFDPISKTYPNRLVVFTDKIVK